MNHNRSHKGCSGISRRVFLGDAGMGFTGLALAAMLQRDGVTRADDPHATPSVPNGLPHLPPKAKHVIWLFMVGGMSHVEGFDPKPALNQFAGKTIAETPHKDVLNSPFIKNFRAFAEVNANGQFRTQLYPMQVGYSKRSQSGLEVSDWWQAVG